MTLKKLLFFLVLLSHFQFCKKPAVVEIIPELTAKVPEAQPVLFVAPKSGIHLREEANERSKSIQILKQYTPIYILETNNTPLTIQGIKGRWILVYTDRHEGYVFDGFLSEKSGERIFSPSKTAYYQIELKSEFTCNKESFEECLVYSAFDSQGKKIRELETFKPQRWLNDDEIEFETHAADGGGFHLAEFKKNIRTGVESNIYSYSGDFDDDQNGFRDLYYCVLKSCIFFRFDIKNNEFSVRDILEPQNSNLKAGHSIISLKISAGKPPSLGETDKYFELLAKKSLEYTDKIFFNFRGAEFEIKFPEKTVRKL